MDRHSTAPFVDDASSLSSTRDSHLNSDIQNSIGDNSEWSNAGTDLNDSDCDTESDELPSDTGSDIQLSDSKEDETDSNREEETNSEGEADDSKSEGEPNEARREVEEDGVHSECYAESIRNRLARHRPELQNPAIRPKSPQWPIYEDPRIEELPQHFELVHRRDLGKNYEACNSDEFFSKAGGKFESEFTKLMESNDLWDIELHRLAVETQNPRYKSTGGFIKYYMINVIAIAGHWRKLDAQIHHLMRATALEAGISPRPIRYMLYPDEPQCCNDDWSSYDMFD